MTIRNLFWRVMKFDNLFKYLPHWFIYLQSSLQFTTKPLFELFYQKGTGARLFIESIREPINSILQD